MAWTSLAAALVSLSCGALGQMFLKLGAGALAARPRGPGPWALIQAALATWQLDLGLVLYAGSAVIWIHVLTRLPLSVAYPMVGLGFVLVLALSTLVLGETLRLVQLAGCALILAGIVLVTRG